MQCSIRHRDDIFGPATRCPSDATYVLRHKGLPVSHRCDEHAGVKDKDGVMRPGGLCDSQYVPSLIQ